MNLSLAQKLICGLSAGLAGCVHDADHHVDRHDFHEDAHHVAPYNVVVSRPAPPNQAPVGGPGHWVWDDTRQQYLWVSEKP